jgi:hypothetical protein
MAFRPNQVVKLSIAGNANSGIAQELIETCLQTKPRVVKQAGWHPARLIDR